MDAGPSGIETLDGPKLWDNESQKEQAKKQDERAEQLQQAVEALKQKVPTTDKKTAFWQAYKTLADEHDEEFHRKYSTDLDTALIFAGLFSAVDSAFIIQIQSGIQHHGTDLRILISQNLLYVSLFSTLLAALLAVLGKQWLLYYLAAGERGTLEARGLERQRKFDGLRRWKFEAVMQMFPLLLQIGLFLFSASLSTYLWTVHISLAVLAIFFTSFGFIIYTALLISAVAAPDSPYQTPLAPLVAKLIPTTLWAKLKAILTPVLAHSIWVIRRLFTACSSCLLKPHLLPLSLKISEKNGSSSNEPSPLFDDAFPAPSAEVPAVSPFQKELFERLFEVLLEALKNHTISMDSAAQIVYLTGQLRNKEGADRHLHTVYNFCSRLPQAGQWARVVLATGLLTRTYYAPRECGDISWIYKVLDSVNALPEDCQWDDTTITGLTGLFNALRNYNAPPAKEHIHLILRAIKIPRNISSRAADLLLRNDVGKWFQDEELRPILQKASAWTYLAHAYSASDALGRPNYACLALGCTLAELPQWEPYIRPEPCSWIAAFWRSAFWRPAFPRGASSFHMTLQYHSILSRFWNPDVGEYEFISDNEKALASTFIILSQIWQDADFADPGALEKMVQTLRCTALTVLRTEVAAIEDGVPPIPDWQITPRFITAFSQPLHNSLSRAVAAIKNRATVNNDTSNGLQKSSPGEREVLDSAAKLLEDVASRMPRLEADSKLDDWRYWLDLRARFDAEIKALEQSLYDFSIEANSEARAGMYPCS
ncbi:hypothetical protein MVEN_01208700 [Mycena venus]|uniref:DUF6535 domain-containing protein n=1 Tax=Mycena venus TaxID=2733690 RepID=A0A8H6Y579_9AGAR|nr:hypothetical protein MVEN_01208700 [Mycena venus]